MSVFDNPHFDAHERVLFAHDPATGLRAIIALHDTRLGPALEAVASGITRVMPRRWRMCCACRAA